LDGVEEIHSAEQVHQITRVLRLSEGDNIIGIHDQQEFLLTIAEIKSSKITLQTVKKLEPKGTELQFDLKVYIPLLKGEKNEWVLQKCTELGVTEFQFVEFNHSVKQNINWTHKLERWKKIITEAVEQSERVKLPIIKEIIPLSQVSLKENELGISLVERFNETADAKGASPRADLLFASNSNINCLSLIFGPEGGFSEAEKIILNQIGFQPKSLGKRILRAETAIVVACGLMSRDFA